MFASAPWPTSARPRLPERFRLPLVLLATCGSAATMFMAITDVLSGIPVIGADLGASQTQLQWIADCYPLVLATLLLPAGVFADRFGRKRFLLIGLALLTAGLAAASLAQSAGALIACLCVAGVGSGLGFPSTLATVTGAVPPERRGMAVSLWAAAVPVGGVTGALVGGVVMEFASWPSVFLVTAGFAAAAFALTAAVVPETRDPQHSDLDVPGALLSAAAVASLVVGLTEGPVEGWGSARTLGWLVASVVLGIGFVRWELHTPRPLLDVRLFRIRAFSAAVLSMLLMFGGLYGVVFMSYQWEAYVLGWSTFQTSLGLLPLAILMLPLALAGTTLAGRIGVRRVMAGAVALGGAGSIVLATAGFTEHYLSILIGGTIFGGCIGLAAGPGTEAISSALPHAQQGVGSAVNDLARELGATLGIVVSGTAFNIGYRDSIGDQLDGATGALASAAHASPAAGMQAAEHAGPAGDHVAGLIITATNAGWTVALITISAAFAISLVAVLRAFPRERVRAGAAEPVAHEA